jgi:hypothetical protein
MKLLPQRKDRKVCLQQDTNLVGGVRTEREVESSQRDGERRLNRRGFLKRRHRSMSVFAEISVSSVLIADMRPQSMLLPVSALVDEEIVETQALLDSGAGGEFMDHSFAQRHNLPLYKLPRKIIT